MKSSPTTPTPTTDQQRQQQPVLATNWSSTATAPVSWSWTWSWSCTGDVQHSSSYLWWDRNRDVCLMYRCSQCKFYFKSKSALMRHAKKWDYTNVSIKGLGHLANGLDLGDLLVQLRKSHCWGWGTYVCSWWVWVWVWGLAREPNVLRNGCGEVVVE